MRRERFLGDAGHIAGAFLQPALLGAVADRPAHLPGELGDDVVVHRNKRVEHGERLFHAVGDGHLRPLRLRGAGAGNRGVERRIGDQRPLGVDRAVDGGDDFGCVCHDLLNSANL